MGKLIVVLLITFMSSLCHAAPAIRLCDKHNDCVDINASGQLPIKIGAPDTGVQVGGMPARRVCDDETHCTDISSDKRLQITFN